MNKLLRNSPLRHLERKRKISNKPCMSLINLITYLLIHFKNKTIHTENNFMYNISKASVEIIFIFDWRC